MENNIHVQLPVKIGYAVLQDVLRSTLIGEMIQKEKGNGEARNYAQVLEVSLYQSPLENFDIALDLEVQTLTSLWKNKRFNLAFHSCIDFNREEQQVSISSYKAVVDTKSKITDALLEGAVNSWFYKLIRKKMEVDLAPKINAELSKINQKLRNQIEAADGIFVSGSLEKVEIETIEAEQRHLNILIRVDGDSAIEIKKLNI